MKDPIHSFSSDFQENKTKPKRTIPKLCFLVNPYGCSHPFEQNRLSWCYLETTGKGGRVASLTDHLVHGCHRGCWGAYGEVAGRGVSLELCVRRFKHRCYREDTQVHYKILQTGHRPSEERTEFVYCGTADSDSGPLGCKESSQSLGSPTPCGRFCCLLWWWVLGSSTTVRLCLLCGVMATPEAERYWVI